MSTKRLRDAQKRGLAAILAEMQAFSAQYFGTPAAARFWHRGGNLRRTGTPSWQAARGSERIRGSLCISAVSVGGTPFRVMTAGIGSTAQRTGSGCWTEKQKSSSDTP